MASQITMVSLDSLVSSNHIYRKFDQLLDFNLVEGVLEEVSHDNNYKGFGILRLFKCLLVQFLEDLSDRELERYLQDSNAGKWFCDFGLTDVTPGFTVFTKIRKRIGTQRLSHLFAILRDQLKAQGYMNEVFTFIDASHLISKAQLWKERDIAIKKKYAKLNNEILPKVAHDKQAKIGCKGKKKYWYGFKKHASVDMQSGLINKVAITPANVTDATGMKNVCPSQGAIYADKGYCGNAASDIAKKKGCYLAAIKKNNMRDKNRDLDRWLSGIRSPYERVFSQQNKKVRYCGIAKNQFAAFMEAICFNLRRVVVLCE